MKNKIKILSLLILLIPMIAFAQEPDTSMYSFVIAWVAFATLHWTFGVFKPLGSILTQKFNIKGFAWILFFIRLILLVICIPIYGESVIFIDFFSLFVLVIISSIIQSFSTIKRGVSSMSVVTPIVNTGKLICPKCGKEMAFGNTRCTACGTNLTNQPLVCPKCKTENLPTSRFCKNCGTPIESAVQQEVYLGDKLSEAKECPKCKKKLTEVAKFCKYCGTDVESIMGKILMPIPKASAGKPIDKKAIDNKIITGTENQAIEY